VSHRDSIAEYAKHGRWTKWERKDAKVEDEMRLEEEKAKEKMRVREERRMENGKTVGGDNIKFRSSQRRIHMSKASQPFWNKAEP